MGTKTLFAFFPQWQGSGPSPELWAGAQELRRRLPGFLFREVPVSLDPVSGITNGILGYEAILRQQQEAYRLVLNETPERIFSLGGDCGIEIVPVSWLNRRYDGQLAVIWLDAHGDLNTPETSPSKHFHGMPLRTLLEEAPHPFSDVAFSRIQPSQVMLAGVRDLDPAEHRFIQESGIPLFGVEALTADPSLPARLVLARGMHKVYLHVDLDVLDPSQFPNVKCPVAEGLSFETLRSVIRSCRAECHVVGGSILEFVEGRNDAGLLELVHDLTGDCPVP